MTSKQRAYLKSLANSIKPDFQIGKSGINDNQIKAIFDGLEANELIKINVLKNTSDDANIIANEIANKTESEVVQILGNKITLYKESTKKPKIVLPQK